MPDLKSQIYLDNSATTRADPEVVEAVVAALSQNYGNASSIHTCGQKARTLVEDSRCEIAGLLGAEPRDVVFTSGGTESDNAALWGIFRSAQGRGNHIITTRIEHPAVLATCKVLEAAGAEVTYLPVGQSGAVAPEAAAAAVTDRTILISVMHSNNETGVIQPVAEIAKMARERGIAMHTDAVQSVGKVPLDVEVLGVDLLSLSGHKFHGPKGIGALWIRKGCRFTPFMTGGSHERRRRAGTENVPAIAGLGVAARLARARLPEMAGRVAGLRDRLERRVAELIPGVGVNGSGGRLPTVSSMSFERVEGEAAVIAMDLEGIALSTGSACSSGSIEPSHVLTAMGLRQEVVQGSLRFSLSRHTSEGEIERTVEALARVVERLRGLSGRAHAGEGRGLR